MRKSSLPPELATLTSPQLAQLDDWLDRFTYPKVQQLFRETHRVEIGIMKLCRYYKRRLKARALTPPGQPALTPADLVAIRNGTPLPDARLNTQLLQLRVLDLVRGVKSAYELRELHQVATYEQRRALTEQELDLEQRKAAHRLGLAKLREQELAFQKWRSAATHLRVTAKLRDTTSPLSLALDASPARLNSPL